MGRQPRPLKAWMANTCHFWRQALCLTLTEEDLVGVCRFAPRKNAQPKLAALLPALKCLYVCPLPFADEACPPSRPLACLLYTSPSPRD